MYKYVLNKKRSQVLFIKTKIGGFYKNIKVNFFETIGIIVIIIYTNKLLTKAEIKNPISVRPIVIENCSLMYPRMKPTNFIKYKFKNYLT